MPALNLLTFLLTWSGRQLETYTQGNITIEFEYDENGLRHRKTVKQNGVITERYDYVWSEGTLISQTYTTYSNGALDSTNSAKFIYDAWGTLQGFILNDTSTYLYTKNLQGDILSIVNESGQTILTYEYDSWGEVSFSATSMQNLMLAYTLSFVSPFTYRGYCYDYDIELYYLQSRYYSAEIDRFINADSTDYLGYTGTVLSYNLFSYCENNSVNYVDENGFSRTYACFFVYNNKGSDFKKQAEWMKKEYFKNKNVITFYMDNWTKFTKHWNSLQKTNVSDIFLFLHGGPGKLYFKDGEVVKLNQIREDLKKIKSITGKIYLLSCQGGTKDEQRCTVAGSFAVLQPGIKVRAVVNGSVYYRAWNQLFARKPLTKEPNAYWSDFRYVRYNGRTTLISSSIGRTWYYG